MLPLSLLGEVDRAPRAGRRMRQLALACALAMPMGVAGYAHAQDAAPPAPAAPASPAPADSVPPTAPAPAAAPAVTLPENEPLHESIESFWHYGKIARYDIAAAEGKRIVATNTDPQELLTMFEAVAAEHHDNLDQWLLRWQGVDTMKDAATQLIETLGKGYSARRADPKFIEMNLKTLAESERGYDIGIDRIRESGELAVPIMIDYLRKPDLSMYHPAIRRALRDLGLQAVNPLLAATEMKDEQTLMTVVNTLGDSGYDVAVPYLVKLLQAGDTSAAVKSAVNNALAQLKVDNSASLSASQLFYGLAEKFYYDNAAVRAEKKSPVAFVWYWGEQKGLTKIDVPQPIFHDVMAKRAAEYSLKLGGTQSDALSLWLSASFQDEADLGDAAKDPTLPADQPSAHYFGVASGTKYLNSALARANRDRNAPVAMRAILGLEDIGGQANLFGSGAHPLMDSLQFPDRLVRYESAFALAAALPRESFNGEDRVVPLLSEALSQTGAANVLVLVPNQDGLNGLMDRLKGAGYNVVGGTTPEQAVNAAAARPAIDAIVVSEDAGPGAIDKLAGLAGQTPRLERAVKVIVTKTKASPYAVQSVNDPMLTTTQAAITDTAALKTTIDIARKRGGLLPLDESTAGKYATRAADLLAKIAINHSPVYDVNVGENLLLAALDDNRGDIVKDAATVLSLISGPEIQPALLQKATDDKTSDELKAFTFKALATHARNFGNKLDGEQVGTLEKVVGSAPNLDVRTAAGEARGALNLPADQAKQLIIQQAKTTTE